MKEIREHSHQMTNNHIITYAMDRAKEEITAVVRDYIGQEELVDLRYPPPDIPYDVAVPCFPYSKKMRKAPQKIAEELSTRFKTGEGGYIESVAVEGGYLNIRLNPVKITQETFKDLDRWGGDYGISSEGKGKTVVIDYSSPNIAKPFSVGNIRSTIIGQAIYNIYTTLGYKVIGDNHIGDWGTQFGKLIYAYRMWGKDDAIKKDPIRELLKLYVRFHEEAGTDEKEEDGENNGKKSGNSMDEQARKYFKQLESGDPEIRKIWRWFVDVSLEDFKRVYDRLGVHFDCILGESFYNDKTDDIIKILENSPLSVRGEDGSLIVPLEKYGIKTPLLIQKSDGATLYATRELASLIYRIKEFKPTLLLYVVGGEQKLHFQQCFKTLELMGYDTRCIHVDFGFVTLKEGKMSTRKGRVIFFDDVIQEAYNKALMILQEKRPDLSEGERQEIAEIIGIGALKFNDLSQNRIKNIVFDWDKMLSFDGDTAPYLQYSHARVCSILRKSPVKGEIIPSLVKEEDEIRLVKKISLFPEIIRESAKSFHPHTIAQYLLELARTFTDFYNHVPVLKADTPDLIKSRIALVEAYSLVIRKGLSILGIRAPERM